MPDPNIIAFPKLKLAYIGICKSGNTSVKLTFMNAFGYTGKNPHHKDFFLYVDYDYLKDKKDWLIFTIIRHPRKRFESCFKQKVWRPRGLHPGFKRYNPIKWKMPFKNFIHFVAEIPDSNADQHFRSMYYDLYMGGQPLVNLILRLEDIELAWPKAVKRIEQHCGLKLQKTLPMSDNDSSKIKAPIKWTDTLDQIHYKRFKKDFKVFNYE